MGDRDFLFSVTSLAENGYANLYGRDITERKQAAEALREAEHLFRSLVLSSSQAVWRYRPHAPSGQQLDPASAGWCQPAVGLEELHGLCAPGHEETAAAAVSPGGGRVVVQ